MLDEETTLASHIQSLEEKLLAPNVRVSAAELDRLLAEDFLEIGSSGRVYDKPKVIASLPASPTIEIALQEFRVKTIAPGVMLANYLTITSINPPLVALRSSIWIFDNERWQLLFHQGTPIKT